MSSTHDTDFYTWTQEQAALLRHGCFADADIENLITELESMGASERRELINRIAVLLVHMLKWRYQSQRRGRSWRLTIETQRFDVQLIIQQNPGLRTVWLECLDLAYKKARIQAAKASSLDKATFPNTCPWTLEQVFDDEFWPE